MIPKLEIRISLNEHKIAQDINNTFYPDFDKLYPDQEIDLYIPLLSCYPAGEQDFHYIDNMLEAMLYNFFPLPLWLKGNLLLPGVSRLVLVEVEPYGILTTLIARISNFLLKGNIKYYCELPYLRLGYLKDVKDVSDFYRQRVDLRMLASSLKDKFYGAINTLDFIWEGKEFHFTVPPKRPLVSPEDPLDSHPLISIAKSRLQGALLKEEESKLAAEADSNQEPESKQEEGSKKKESSGQAQDPKQPELAQSQKQQLVEVTQNFVLKEQTEPTNNQRVHNQKDAQKELTLENTDNERDRQEIEKHERIVYPITPHFISHQVLAKQVNGPGYKNVLQRAFLIQSKR